MTRLEHPPAGGLHSNGSAPLAPVTLYEGDVMHARLNPFGHRFTYRVFTCLIDIDRLGEAARQSSLFSVNRFNILSFHESDHTGDRNVVIGAFVRDQLEDAELSEPIGRILLLCYPRFFGFVFNPLATYFVYGQSGRLIAAVYEVRNTFGQRHTYVARVEPGELSDAGLRQRRRKLFHVSPFIGMNAAYQFRLLPPGEKVRLRILETENDAPVLSATFHGKAQPMTGPRIVQNALKYPLMTAKVMIGIHWEALKLWLKGATYHSVPDAPRPVSHQDESAPSDRKQRPVAVSESTFEPA